MSISASQREHGRGRCKAGGLAVPGVLHGSPSNTPDAEALGGTMGPGAACVDAPVSDQHGAGWLLQHLGGEFTGLVFGTPDSLDSASRRALAQLQQSGAPIRLVNIGAPSQPASGSTVLRDDQGLAAQRYSAAPGTFYLIRPDQHVCARWRRIDAQAVGDALARASGAHLPASARQAAAMAA